MPNSSDRQPFDVLFDYLGEVFAAGAVRRETADTREPLITLKTANAYYGFAVATGDIPLAFERAYKSFKELYLAAPSLKQTEPGFVFCIAAETKGLEQFISRIETDVYFCRKFVVQLSADLGKSLSALPFMPLAPIGGVSLRPYSAQTFLQKAGMPALLAKNIVVPHERAPRGIFEDCIAEKYGPPVALDPEASPGLTEVALNDNAIFLERVTIQNVRAYRKAQTFDLGEHVTILYGPNGFGKTSFFDSIDFAITGAVGRLREGTETQARKTIQHLDSQGEDAFVTLAFRKDGERQSVSRRVTSRKTATLNTEVADRKRVLATLTNSTTKAADRVENYISLFRATHLFSQEQQELTRNFREDCRLSMTVVSRMLAVEDYETARAKAESVRDYAEEQVAKCRADIDQLKTLIAADSTQLDALRAVMKESSSPELLQAQLADLQARLAAHSVMTAPVIGDVESLRAARAVVDKALNDHSETIEKITALIPDVAGLSGAVLRAATSAEAMRAKEAEAEAAKGPASDTARLFEEARAAFIAAEQEATAARKMVDDFTWLKSQIALVSRYLGEVARATEDIDRTDEAFTLAKDGQRQIADRLRLIERDFEPLAGQLGMKQADAVRLESIAAALPALAKRRARATAIVAEETANAKQIADITQARTAAEVAGAKARAAVDALEEEIGRVVQNESELAQLLSQIEGHVEDGFCPLCGDDHGAKDNLIARIQERRRSDRAAPLKDRLLVLHAELARITTLLQSASNDLAVARAKSDALKNERTLIEREDGNFRQLLNSFGLDIASPSLSAAVKLALERVSGEILELRNQHDLATVSIGQRKVELLAATGAADDAELTLRSLRELKATLEASLNEIRSDDRWLDDALELSPEDLDEIELERSTAFSESTEKLAAARKTRDEAIVALEVARRTVTTTTADLARRRTENNENQRQVLLVRERAAALGFAQDVQPIELDEAIARSRSSLAAISALRDLVVKVELALDASTTAASHLALQNSMREKERRKKVNETRLQSYQPWLQYFRNVFRILQAEQGKAVGNFTNQYGPRTSIIQRRLRSVYSFEEVEIKEHDASIVVRVKRGDENLRPVDYFSQSQQQTLLLGLFLTASSSQTWSSFSPVFLDDPVTHFDDLNTYSLLDLISGLLQNETGKRQFVISTCDERLLQLALQKFRYLGDKAQFYRFEAIGRDGPKIAKLQPN